MPVLEANTQKEVESLCTEVENLHNEVEELKDANINLQERNAGLQETADELRSKVETLYDENESLKNLITILKKRNGDVGNENQRLIGDHKDVCDVNFNLRYENEKLKDIFSDLLLTARTKVLDKSLNPLVANLLTNKVALYLKNTPNLTNEYINSVVFALWSTGHKDVLTQLITRDFLVIDKEKIDDMDNIFVYIVNNFIKLNTINTKSLIKSYLGNRRTVSTEQFKRYLEKVEFENLNDVLREYYLEESNKKIAEFA